MGDEVVIQNRCSLGRVDARLIPLVEAARDGLLACCGERVMAVRLQGSVARGEAQLGHADLDMIALLAGPPTPADGACVEALAAQLGASSDLVSRCDLEAVDGCDLAPFRRFVLATDSLHLWGEDTLTSREMTIERRALVRLVTPDPGGLLADYLAWANDLEGASVDEINFASRIMGKDVLKILRGLLLLRGAPYEVAIPDIASQIRSFAPEHASLATALLAHYQSPVSAPPPLLETMRAAAAALAANAELAAVLATSSAGDTRSPELR